MNLNRTGLIQQCIREDCLYSTVFATEFLPVSSPAVLRLVKPAEFCFHQDCRNEAQKLTQVQYHGCQQQAGESLKVEIKSQESTSTLLLESPNSCRGRKILKGGKKHRELCQKLMQGFCFCNKNVQQMCLSKLKKTQFTQNKSGYNNAWHYFLSAALTRISYNFYQRAWK